MFECFNELISDEEIADVSSFNQEHLPDSSHTCSSSSEDHKKDCGSSDVNSRTCTTKRVASGLTMDDDPDFAMPKLSGPAQGRSDNTRSIQLGTKATSQASGKVKSTKSGQESQDRSKVQKQSAKRKTSTNASRLANYFLQNMDSAPAKSIHHQHQLSHETTCIDKDAIEESGNECKGDSVDSLEWFGLNTEEDLQGFEQFDDETDFLP